MLLMPMAMNMPRPTFSAVADIANKAVFFSVVMKSLSPSQLKEIVEADVFRLGEEVPVEKGHAQPRDGRDQEKYQEAQERRQDEKIAGNGFSVRPAVWASSSAAPREDGAIRIYLCRIERATFCASSIAQAPGLIRPVHSSSQETAGHDGQIP